MADAANNTLEDLFDAVEEAILISLTPTEQRVQVELWFTLLKKHGMPTKNIIPFIDELSKESAKEEAKHADK